MNNILIVFAKYPESGRVKTRLAKSIGNDNARKLYELFVPLIINRTKSDEYATKVFFDPPEKQEQIKKWLGEGTNLFAQSGGSLGERLNNAFIETFKQGAEKVVVIGSDSPLLNHQIINQAFIDLGKYNCVIGPSSDGGYYLLGLKQPAPDLFDFKEWSTNVVFEKTKQKALKLNYKISILEEHFDIDEKADLILLRKKLADSQGLNEITLNDLKDILSDVLKNS